MKRITFLIIIFLITLSGCASMAKQQKLDLPTTGGDYQSATSFGYHPMDPLPVDLKYEGEITNERIMKSLPDETMRIAAGKISGSGGITFGPAGTGYKGSSYVVVLDYIKFSTRPFGAKLSKEKSALNLGVELFPFFKVFEVKDFSNIPKFDVPDKIVPVYIGVGLRLTANITIHEGSVNLGSLFALGLAAEAKQISGTLVLQTLGISGENISSIIPMPAEINSSTIQNAILSLGSIKAKMYRSDTIITPRVVGVYNNLGGGPETINGFISSLLKEPLFLNIK